MSIRAYIHDHNNINEPAIRAIHRTSTIIDITSHHNGRTTCPITDLNVNVNDIVIDSPISLVFVKRMGLRRKGEG
jgi:hypothetical protein